MAGVLMKHVNVIHKRAAHPSERRAKPPKRVYPQQSTMAPPKQANQEDRIQLAKQAIKQGQIQSIRAAAEAYDVPERTLSYRIHGRISRDDCTPNSRKLTLYKEDTII